MPLPISKGSAPGSAGGFASGARGGGSLTGVLLEVRPVVGAPMLALLSEADIFDEEGTCLQHARFLPLVVAPLAAIEEAPL